MWEKSVQYLSKMGGIILIASVLIWALGYFPREVEYERNYEELISQVQTQENLDSEAQAFQIHLLEQQKEAERLEGSYIGRIGHAMEPVLSPLGFDWKIGVSLLTGVAAKEIVVSSMGVLYQSGTTEGETLQDKIKQQKYRSGEKKGQYVYNPIVAFTLMLFILIYFPCVAVIAAIRRELGNSWAIFTMVYTTTLAWIVSFAFYQIANLLV